MRSKKRIVTTLLPLAALAAMTIAVYLNTLWNGFVYDDNDNILANPWIRDFSRIPEIFSKSSMEFMGLAANTYRPILHLAFNIEYHIFGTNPFGYHLVAVLLHTINALAVFFVAGRILKNADGRQEDVFWWAPFFAGAVFALHPINSESVAWVSAIPELVFTLLVLTALYIHVTADHERLPGPVAIGAIYFMALLAKETAIVLLPMLVAYDLIFKGKGSAKSWRTYLACVAGAALYMAMRTYAVGGIVHEEVVRLSLLDRAMNTLPLFLNYIKKLLLPLDQNAMHVLEPATSLIDIRVLSGAALATGYIITAFLLRRKKTIYFSMLWMALPLTPVLVFMPVLSKASFAERYLYLSTAGFGLGLAALIEHLLSRRAKHKWPVLAAAASLLIAYGAGTVNRNTVWKNDLTLWSDVTAKSPGNIYGHFELANAYLSAGDRKRALAEYRKVLEINPGTAQAHYNIGIIYLQESLLEDAASEFRIVLKIDPRHRNAREKLQNIEGALALE